MDILYLSSDLAFSTLEGEGPNAGKPSVFLRLAMCNLTCSKWATPENPFGCDSYTAWSKKTKFTFEELFKLFEEKGFDKLLQRGDILKITGGEPLIQQKVLIEFIEQVSDRLKLRTGDWKSHKCSIEFETNGTILPDEFWNKSPRAGVNIPAVSFICSPKLSNNGDPEEKRYKPEVLRWHARNPFSYFKFVVTSPEDLVEIKDKYLDPFWIDPEVVWLMPEGTTVAQLKAKAQWLAEICKKEGFNFSNRLQVFIWDQTLGV